MPRSELLIGSHIGFCAPDYFLDSVRKAVSFGANALMIYSGSPQHSFRVPLERTKKQEGLELMKEAGLPVSSSVPKALGMSVGASRNRS